MKVSRLCLTCGKEIDDINHPNKKFCSYICYNRNRPKRSIALIKFCKFCGKEFITMRNSPRKYCSRSCFSKVSLLPREEKNCFICGKAFIVIENSIQKYCSRFCQHKSLIGHVSLNKKEKVMHFCRCGCGKLCQSNYILGHNTKDNWKNPEYAKKVMHRREMSKPENEFNKMIVENCFPYIYTGNVSNKTVVIGGKIPDFTHETEKKVIEIWGNFFHKGQNPQDRIDYFGKYGYDCLIIWASELHNRLDVFHKVRKFSIREI